MKHWARWFAWGAFLLCVSCGNDNPSKPPACYDVVEVFRCECTVQDTVAAHTAFESYIEQLRDSSGYPVYGWEELAYSRSAGTERYRDALYWGIVALARTEGGQTAQTTRFRVRADGTVVSMLGCI